MGVMDNGRSWTCTVYAYDIQFGNPAQTSSVTWLLTGTYPNTKIKNWKLTDTMAQNGDVAFGSTGSKALTLELIDLPDKDFGTGAIMGIVLGGAASGSWYFYADSVEWTTNFGTTTTYSAKVTAYDTMYYAANRISSVNLPSYYTNMITDGKATVQNCRDIAQYCIRHARYDLIRERARELADDPSTTPSDKTRYETYANMLDSHHDDTWTAGTITMDDVVSNAVGKVNIDAVGGYMQMITLDKTMTGRSLLGRMAAFMGMRAYCNNNVIGNIGKISFAKTIDDDYKYNNGTPVATKDVYDNGFVAEGKKSFKYFISGTTENPASAGKKTSNGYSTMVVNCPDMDSTRLNHLASSVAGKEYEIGKVKFRGDPALKAGMKVKFPDAGGNVHDTIATKVVSNYDGGFYQTVYSEGKSDADIEFEQNRYAENATTAAEQKDPDAGGGGGTPTLHYYSETESPDKATINVDGITVEVDNSGTELQAQNYHLTLDKTSGYTLTNGGNEFMTLNSTQMIFPGNSYSETAKINFGDTAWSGGSWTHKTNVAVHGNFGARNIGTNNVLCGVVAADRIGFINTNSGTMENPAYYWSIYNSGGQVGFQAGYDITFDLEQANNTTTIRANTLEARTINYTELYGGDVHATYGIDNGIVGYPGNNQIRFNGGQATYAGSVFMNFQNDKIVFTQRDYVTDPGDGHFISMTTTTITMDLTATNINDLFTFSQS